MKHIYEYDESLPEPFYIGNKNFEKGSGKLFTILYGKLISSQFKKYKPFDSVEFERKVFCSFDKTEQRYYVLKPKNSTGKLSSFIYIHGGGFMWPLATYMADMMCRYVEELNVQVLIPEYRLCPKYNCETLLGDCFSFVEFVKENSDNLNVDMENLLLYGDSAGGALATSVAAMCRDKELNIFKGQLLIYPATDNRRNYRSMRLFSLAPWSFVANVHAWNLYLKNSEGGEKVKYAIPMNNDVEGMPPTYVEVHEIDILRDQGIAYAQKLRRSGVPIQFKLVKKSYHGADTQFGCRLSEELIQYRINMLKEFLHK